MQSTEELERMAAIIDAELARRRLRRSCEWCRSAFTPHSAKGRFCSGRCRVAAHRNPLPIELTSLDRWVRFDRAKRPLTTTGRSASSTDPTTWASYADAKVATAGVGMGFILNGDGIGVLDLDHCISNGVIASWAQDIIDANAGTFIEISISGTGLHIWGLLPQGPGRKIRDGRSIEIYTTGRYIALGSRLPGASRKLCPITLPDLA